MKGMLGQSRYKGRISGRKCEYVKSVCLVLFKECKVIALLLVQQKTMTDFQNVLNSKLQRKIFWLFETLHSSGVIFV